MRQRERNGAFAVLAACILLKLGLGGGVACLAGNFVTPVVEELGCQVSQFTMMISVEAAAMAMLYTTAAKVLSRARIGYVMGAAAIVEVIGIALMGFYREVWLFYLSGALVGAGMAFTGFVAVPIVVNMWFLKKAGTALGIIIAAEGISTVLFTHFTARLIVQLGWRAAYLVMAAICLVVSVPGLFLFVKSPAQAGCRPYGAEEEQPGKAQTGQESVQGLTRRQALRSPIFYAAWLACMMYSIGYSVQQYVASFATMELGHTIPYGATAAMCMSLGCVVSSMILGYVNDRFGVCAGLGWGALFALLGYGGMLFSIRNPDFVIPAALLVGLGGSMYTVQSPLLARTALGNRDYSAIWSVMMTGNSLIGAFSFAPVGLFYDIGGSYKGAFVMSAVLYAAAFAAGAFAVRRGRARIRDGH